MKKSVDFIMFAYFASLGLIIYHFISRRAMCSLSKIIANGILLAETGVVETDVLFVLKFAAVSSFIVAKN